MSTLVRKIFISTLCLSLSACSLVSSEPVMKQDKNYKFKDINSNWNKVKDKKVDYLYKHKDGGLVYSKSYCDYFKGSAKKISESFINKIKYTSITEKNNKSIKGNDAQFTALISKVENKTIYIFHQGIKASNCYYDITGIGHSQDFKDEFHSIVKRIDI